MPDSEEFTFRLPYYTWYRVRDALAEERSMVLGMLKNNNNSSVAARSLAWQLVHIEKAMMAILDEGFDDRDDDAA